MSTDTSDSERGLGVYLRHLGVAVFLFVALVASRGVIGGLYEYTSDVNWLAGVLVLVVVSTIPLWLFLRYESSHSEE